MASIDGGSAAAVCCEAKLCDPSATEPQSSRTPAGCHRPGSPIPAPVASSPRSCWQYFSELSPDEVSDSQTPPCLLHIESEASKRVPRLLLGWARWQAPPRAWRSCCWEKFMKRYVFGVDSGAPRPPFDARACYFLFLLELPAGLSLQGVYDLAASVGMVAPDGRLQEAGQLEGKPSSGSAGQQPPRGGWRATCPVRASPIGPLIACLLFRLVHHADAWGMHEGSTLLKQPAPGASPGLAHTVGGELPQVPVLTMNVNPLELATGEACCRTLFVRPARC